MNTWTEVFLRTFCTATCIRQTQKYHVIYMQICYFISTNKEWTTAVAQITTLLCSSGWLIVKWTGRILLNTMITSQTQSCYLGADSGSIY